jgi:hypothetical protein
MRNGWLILLLPGLPLTIIAADMSATNEIPSLSPSYHEIFRFDEDYSCLSDPAKRTDWFDPIKYIPLRTNAPDWYLTVGGQFRERFEGNYEPNFGVGGQGDDSYLLQRLTLSADLRLGERVRVFAEGISGLMEGETPPPPPPQQDPIDLQFAFLDLIPYLTDDESLTLRVGRFGLSLGAGRLVASRAAPNIPFKFDGVQMLYARPQWEATAFLTQPGRDSGGFDGEDHTTTFWGLYLTHWFDAPRKIGLDLYYLGIHDEHGAYASGTGDELRHSLGVREFGSWRQWDWNTEEVVQFGSFGNESILAWTASLDSGYTWDAKFEPRLGLKTDVTSGDSNLNGGQQQTFDALYFKSGYFNDASLLRPQNIIDVHPNASVNLTRHTSLDGGVDAFWRYSRNDAVYAVPGFIAVPALKNSSSYVGSAVDLNWQWQIQRHVTLGASFVHFFTDSYIHAAGGRDVDYVSTTLSFLF